MIKKILPLQSIAKRLAFMYAIAAVIVLTAVVIALYCIEMTEIDVYQTAEMKNRFSWFEHALNDTDNPKDWTQLKERFSQITQEGQNRIYLRVESADSSYVFNAPFEINPHKLYKHHGFSKDYIGDRYFRILSKKIPPNGQRPEVILSLAVDTYFYESEDFLLDVAFGFFLIVGSSTIAILGWIIARRSLAPVDMLSQYAENISPHNLSDRLPNTNLPTELSGLITSFNGVLNRLEESYNRQSAFNSDVAHELRTPVGNLIGETEVALSRPRSVTELEEVMQSNLEELERLRTIINDMLFLSRADQGEMAINRTKVSLSEEVRQTAEFLEVLFEERRNTLTITGDAVLKAESSLLKRALTNLLNNAVEHGIPHSPVSVEITTSKNFAILTVTNYGENIPENNLKNIFDRFYRVSKERKNSGSNHGLGLAIVKAIIIMHQGEVFASSSDGVIKIGFKLPLE